MKATPLLTKVLSQEFIKEHAIPSNIVYGTAIYKRGAVKIIDSAGALVEAWVGGLSGKVVEGGGTKRRVTFTAAKTTLKWSCTGNPKDHQIFCKHCVALALALLND